MYCHSTKIKSNLLCTVTAGGVGDFYSIVAEAEAKRAGLTACAEWGGRDTCKGGDRHLGFRIVHHIHILASCLRSVAFRFSPLKCNKAASN